MTIRKAKIGDAPRIQALIAPFAARDENVDRFARREYVADVGEVDRADDLLRRQIDEQFPERLSFAFRPQGTANALAFAGHRTI